MRRGFALIRGADRIRHLAGNARRRATMFHVKHPLSMCTQTYHGGSWRITAYCGRPCRPRSLPNFRLTGPHEALRSVSDKNGGAMAEDEEPMLTLQVRLPRT